MRLRSEVISATFVLALMASNMPCFSVSLFTNPQQMYTKNTVGHLNYGVRSPETSEFSEERLLNFGSIASLGSYFTTFYSYFESGMNLLWGHDKHMNENRDDTSKKVYYKGYQLLRVTPRTDVQVHDVLALREETDGLMYWLQPAKNRSADILTPPDLVIDVKQFLQLRGIEFVVLLKDVQVC
jgi:hypothetical protein